MRDASGRPTGVIDGDGGTGAGEKRRRVPERSAEGHLRVEQHADAQGSQQRRPDRVRWWMSVRGHLSAVAARGPPQHAVLLLPHGRRRRWQAGASIRSSRPFPSSATSTATNGSTTSTGASVSSTRRTPINDLKPTAPPELWVELGPVGARAGEGRHHDLHSHDHGVDRRGAASAGRGDRQGDADSTPALGVRAHGGGHAVADRPHEAPGHVYRRTSARRDLRCGVHPTAR